MATAADGDSWRGAPSPGGPGEPRGSGVPGPSWNGRSIVGRHPGWPAALGPLPSGAGDVALRPLRRRDGPAWRELRLQDQRLIARWDATSTLTWEQRHTAAMFRAQRGLLFSAARRGEALPFAVTVDGRFAGQMTFGGLQRGVLQSAWLGYWVQSGVQGHGVATTAAALAVAHAFDVVGLHRVEATISPENAASRAVVTHVGFRQEGRLQRYLDIDGAWRDHLLYAITVEDLPAGVPRLDALLAGYRSSHS